jgi:hypothetical protein
MGLFARRSALRENRRLARAETIERKLFGQILYSKKRRRISNPACLVWSFQKTTPGGVLTIS